MNDQELQQLLTALTDSGLSDEQLTALQKLLVENPDLRKEYVTQIQMHTLLLYGVHQTNSLEVKHDSAAAFAEYVRKINPQKIDSAELQPTLETAQELCENLDRIDPSDSRDLTVNRLLAAIADSSLKSQTVPRLPLPEPGESLQSNSLNNLTQNTTPATWGNFRSFFLLLLAIIFGIGAAEGWIQYRKPQVAVAVKQQDPVPQTSNDSTPVAFLTSAMGCDLADSKSKKNWSIGDGIRLGDEITFREGIADFRLASNGVSLSIEGPATLVMTSANSVVLEEGKLIATVPWKAVDFQVIAGTNRLTVVDAEFGVQAKGNTVNVHVFSGEVTATLSPYSLKEGIAVPQDDKTTDEETKLLPIVVKQSEAVELTSNSEGNTSVRHFAANKEQFASRISMAGQLQVTSRYVDAVIKSKPVGYWRFETVENNEIRNEIPTGCSLITRSNLSLRGDATNHVLETGQTNVKDHLVSAVPIDNLNKNFSVELWIKPSHYQRGYLVSFVKNILREEDIESISKGDLNHKYDYGFLLETLPDYGYRPGTLHCVNMNPIEQRSSTANCFSEKNLYKARQWQHVVVLKGNSFMTVYLNGKLVASVKCKTTLVEGQHLVVGPPQPAMDQAPFIGQLDELSIYNRVLTIDEIKEHFQAVTDKKSQPEI